MSRRPSARAVIIHISIYMSIHTVTYIYYIYILIIIINGGRGSTHTQLLRVYLYSFFIIIILLETRRSRVSTNMAAAHQRDVIFYRTGSERTHNVSTPPRRAVPIRDQQNDNRNALCVYIYNNIQVYNICMYCILLCV